MTNMPTTKPEDNLLENAMAPLSQEGVQSTVEAINSTSEELNTGTNNIPVSFSDNPILDGSNSQIEETHLSVVSEKPTSIIGYQMPSGPVFRPRLSPLGIGLDRGDNLAILARYASSLKERPSSQAA